MWLYTIILAFSVCIIPSVAIEKCESCTRIVISFQKGLDRTAKANFGGGNTQWEESRLGSYAFSETRLVDIIEGLCKDEPKDDRMVCHSLVEGFEEFIENWWAKEFRGNQTKAITNLRQRLCVQHASICCPYNTFGPKCSPCPTPVDDSSNFCSGHGSCNGNGTKSGIGNCSCDEGYSGVACSQCASGYYSNATLPISCEKCHAACSECFGPNTNSCSACAKGYEMQHTDTGAVGCQDVNECNTLCKAEHEVCTNTEGSFQCDCADGYHRVDGQCVEKPQDESKDDSDKEDDEDKNHEEEEGKKGEDVDLKEDEKSEKEQKESDESESSNQAANDSKDEL